MTFIEIAGGSEGRVLIPLTALSRVEGRPDGQRGATIWLLDGKSYGVKERPDEVRIERWITPWWHARRCGGLRWTRPSRQSRMGLRNDECVLVRTPRSRASG